MSRIKEIELSKTKDNRKKVVEYFIDSTSSNNNYKSFKDICYGAEKTLYIATTSGLNDTLIESINSVVSNNIRVYLLFKDFSGSNKESLSKFTTQNPVVIRECPELDNDFIIVDKVESYVYMSSLNRVGNHYLELSSVETSELFYLFNYLFWDKSIKEQIAGLEVTDTSSSPYPPFNNYRGSTSYSESELDSYDSIVVPEDKSYLDLKNKTDRFYLKRDLNRVVKNSSDKGSIGLLNLSHNIIGDIDGMMEYKKDSLGDIPLDTSIKDFNSDWKKDIQITESKVVNLPSVTSEAISSMKETEPNDLPEEKYSREVIYKWVVKPPMKPKGAVKSKLYSEYDNLIKELNRIIAELQKSVKSVEDEKHHLVNLFSGAARKAKTHKNKLIEFRELKLSELNYNNLKDRLEEFKNLYNEVISNRVELTSGIRRKEAENKWIKEKNQKEAELSSLKNKFEDLKKDVEKMNTLKNSLTSLEKNDPRIKEITKELNNLKSILSGNPEKKIRKMENDIKSLTDDIDKKYSKFNYNFEASSRSSNKGISFTLPILPLPEVGALYEHNSKYYLEIINHEDYDMAKEILMKRYNKDDVDRVVVGE